MILGIRRARRAFALCSIPAIGLWVGLVAVSVLFHAPAEGVAAFLVTSAIGRVLAIAQAVGVVASFLGLFLSFRLDLPTGTTVVATLGGLLALVVIGRGLATRTR
ncbi:MAG TPA: metal ABC transporter permease [Gemmatimonadota bacterium]|jgi:ABC-type Mn2+/Zn2+ transport system permease subunit